jgi:hypothetical protein
VTRSLAVAVALAFSASPVVAAAATAADGKIGVEFNDLKAGPSSCRAVFVINNDLDKPLDKLSLRVVAFDKDQHASLFLSLDVGALPAAKTRILRFDLGTGVACGDINRLVLDDVTSCDGAGMDPAACLGALALSTRSGVAFDF